MTNNNKNTDDAYKALMGSIFGTAKPVDENPVTDRRAAEWLHENLTDDEIWEVYDTVKWEHELTSGQEEVS